MSNSTDSAFESWSQILGARHVEQRGDRVTAALQATFRLDRRIAGMIWPGTTAEVQECVKIAARHKVPIYPISRGKNWGLGSSLPAADDCVVMNLGQMN